MKNLLLLFKMKSLLLPLFLSPILLASCSSNKYSSFIEAERACKDWSSDAKWYPISKKVDHNVPEFFGGNNGIMWSPKACEHDKETRQIIGWKITARYVSPLSPERANGEKAVHFEQKVEERFYY